MIRINKVEIKKEGEYIKFAFGDGKTMNVFLLESDLDVKRIALAVRTYLAKQKKNNLN